jgi:gluconate 2-dehydrogenase gamma chain
VTPRIKTVKNDRENVMVDGTIPRRDFLLSAGTAIATGLASTVPGDAQAPTVSTSESQSTPVPAACAGPEIMLALTATEAAFISAAVDAFIPDDELSPSGTDCGIVSFIDRQLASAWGGGAKMYRSGPYQKGKPEQGYQLALMPKEFFSAGIAEANEWSRKTYGKEFDRLAAADRISALKAMEEGKAEFIGLGSKPFFDALLTVTMEGFFSDPIYGGNRDKASWKMLGFPGLPATYASKVDEYLTKRYTAPPQSIADFS